MCFLHHGPNEEDGRKRLLVMSALDVWSMGDERGAPSLWMTLNGYAKAGWKVFFVTGNRGGSSDSGLDPNVRVYRFDARWLKRLMRIRRVSAAAKILWWIWFQIAAISISISIRRSCEIDVVYAYEICGVVAAKILSRFWRIPIVSRFQGTVLAGPLRHRRRLLRYWDHIIAMKVPTDLVIMTDDGTQGDAVLRSLGVDPERVRFWTNGVAWDLYRTLPTQNEARTQLAIVSSPVLLTVSRLASWKRVDRSIGMLPHLVQRFPGLMLLVVGDGPELDRLKELAKRLGVTDHVRFEGAVQHDRLPLYYAAADVFLSLYDISNAGNPLLEAMAAGTCIVTLDNGDTARFVADEERGLLVNPAEMSDLARRVSSALASPELRTRLARNARDYALEHFWTWAERMHEEIETVKHLSRSAGSR